jgi:peroxiredoxin
MIFIFHKVSTLIIAAILLVMVFGYTIINDEKVISDFSLQNTDGQFISLKNYPNAKGFIIIFTCNHCPFAKLYPPRFNELNIKYKALNVPLIAISSTDTVSYEDDTFTKMREKSSKENFNFPYLFDGNQLVAKDFKAQKTPHAFVIWKENGKWIIKYDGAIDDNGMEASKVQNHYVANAVDALLNNKAIEINKTKSIGCKIAFRN